MSIANDKFCRPVRRRYNAARLLFALAIIAQILMPYTQLSADQTAANGAQTVVICTSAGLVRYVLNPDGSLQEKPAGPVPSAPCEYCQICQFSNYDAADLVSFVPYDFASWPLSSPIADFRIDHRKFQEIVGWQPSRAPPIEIDFIA